MRALRMHLICHVLLGLALLLRAAAALAFTVTDDRGVDVVLAHPPQRIVSLLPSLTESICALNQCQRLVGLDRYSDWPEAVRNLPQVGGGLDPNVESIVALHPDLVLMAKSSRAVARLEALGIKVVALEPHTFQDVQRVLDKLGALLGVPDAQRVWRAIEADVSAAAQSLPASVHGTRVYYEVSSAPYAAGSASFIGEMLARLGVQNIVPAALGPFPKLNPEFIVRADPELIMLGEQSALSLAQRPGWPAISALRQHRICTFNAAQFNVLSRPGPRLAEAARILAQCLIDHPALSK